MKAAILLLLLFALRSCCELQKDFVDPWDMTGAGVERPIVPEKRSPQSQPPPAKPMNPFDPVHSSDACPSDARHSKSKGIDYRAFYRQLVRQLWSKIDGAHQRLGTDELRAFVHISKRAKHVLDAFANDDKESAMQEVNNAFDSIFLDFTTAQEQVLPDTSSWFHPAALRQAITYMILACVLVLVVLPAFFIVRSNFSGAVRFFIMIFYLSWLWSWIFLYKKEVAVRRATYKSHAGACQPEPWLFEFAHYLANYILVVPDRCAALLESLEVDPWLEVTPVRALVHMLTQMLLEPLRPVAENLVRFVRIVCAGLPILHAIAALFVAVFFLLILLTFCFRYRIRIPLFLAVEPAEQRTSTVLTPESVAQIKELFTASVERRDSMILAPESETRIKELINDSMERHHRDLEKSLLVRRNSMMNERILTRRALPKADGDGPLEEEESAEESGEEAARRPPEVLM